MHKISARCQSYGMFHNNVDDLLKDEERFWRYFRMSSNTFKYITELIHASLRSKIQIFEGPLALRGG